MLASSNPESAKLVDSTCTIVSDWHDVVQRSSIAGVIIATPPTSHAAIARAAMDAGKAVLIEKPLTLSTGEAEMLLHLANRNESFVMVDHIHLYNSAFRELCRHIVDDGSAIRGIASSAGASGPFRSDVSVLWDWGPHDLSMCLRLLDASPVEVRAKCLERRRTERGDGETIQIELLFPNDVAASIILSNLLTQKKRSFGVNTETRRYLYDDTTDDNLTVENKEASQRESLAVDPTLPLARVVETFADGILTNAKDRSGLVLGAEIVRILAHCQEQLDAAEVAGSC